MTRGQVAASVRKRKALHPHLYCPKCLWKTGGGPCPRHGGPAWTPDRQTEADLKSREVRGEDDSSGLAWWCRQQTTENLRDELDRAIRLEADQRERLRMDPEHEAAYRLTVERSVERQHAIQAELKRRVV